MSSFQPQRDFINEQETPAGETLTEFKEIKVKIEEEMEDQTEINVKSEELMDDQTKINVKIEELIDDQTEINVKIEELIDDQTEINVKIKEEMEDQTEINVKSEELMDDRTEINVKIEDEQTEINIRSEEEMDDQLKLLDFSPIPKIVLLRKGGRGRPTIHITREQIDFLLAQGHTVKKMANIFGCSASFLYKKSKALGVPIRGRLAAVTDEDLETNIRQLKSLHPNSGTEMMRGLLHARGLVVPQRKVREMMARINPMATARRWSSAVTRRVHHVPYPHSLWHIDGNMRLIRWGFVIHGGIDGRSRLITYLNCSTDNRASSVLFHFLKATGLYGLPSRVRSDHGGENVQVALVMDLLQGSERRSHISGESIHNQRIERLWRNVFLHVLQPFYSMFYNLEDSALLDPSDDVHKLSLHIVFLPEIQSQLEQYRKAWNHHSLRTENNKTPTQIWTERMSANMGSNSTATNNVFDENSNAPETLEELLQHHGLGPLPTTDAEQVPSVIVEPPQTRLSQQQLQSVNHAVNHISDLKAKYQACCAEIANALLI